MIGSNISPQRMGVLLVVISAVVFSSAGIFTKAVHTNAWGVIFWRGLAAAIFTYAYMGLRGGFGAEHRAFGAAAWAVAILGGIGTACFIAAFKFSSVANVTLIYASVPFVAAGFAWVWLKERPSKIEMIASLFAFMGVMIIVSKSFGNGTILGDFLAFCMTVMIAGMIVVYRKYPDTSAALPAAVSSVILLPFGLWLGAPFASSVYDIAILILFGLVFAIASVTLAEGARRIAPARVALVSTLEMPLAPILAFMILSEIPNIQTILGGFIILLAVIWSQTQIRDDVETHDELS